MLTKEQFLKDAVNLHIRTETEEIFWKVVDKLIELGFKPYASNTRDALWFTKYIFLYTGDASIHPRSAPDGKKEIQVSDILGSDYDIDKFQFEVGKWYKFTGSFGEYISRFKTVKNNNFITDTGYIFNGKYKIDTSNGAIINIDREFTEVPVEEIQQYLPDGHPDKLPKLLTVDDLVEGEVYFAEFDKEEWSSLFYCKTPPKFTVRLYVSDKYTGKRYDPGNWTFTEGVNYRLATPEEKRWLDVCISEGKFVEKEVALRDYDMYGKVLKYKVNEKEMKEGFKIGDWVYADRKSDGDFRYEHGDLYIPVFKVEEIYKPGEWLRPVKGRSSGVLIEHCRLATPEEIAKVTKPVEKSFEFNKWYKSNNADGLFFIQSKNTGYGFRSNHVNYWFTNNKDFEWNIDGLEPATDSEVKERLLNYTKEKYPLGTKFKCMIYNKEFTVTNPNYMDMFDELETIWVGVKEQYSGKIFDSDGKWAEIISTPETKESKEMQLSDLKNPVFNIGDKVRVIANSLREFNSSWVNGNNTTCKKGYEGLITQIGKVKSIYDETNTWCYLDNNSNAISCNLLELVEPVKKEFDRNWYVLPEYKQPIKTEEELSHIIDTNEDLRNEIQGLINQRDFKSSDFVEPIIIKNKKQKRNKLIIVNN